ncbi:MAG: type II toxin-antitoxin system VapC family toxin [bacterium]|nr:type II toxin-antitoxin system VapC family toxin [bacterium]
MLVIDASAVLELLLRTPAAARVEERLRAVRGNLYAPHLLDFEVTQVLHRYCSAGDLGSERAQEALRDLSDLGIRRYAHRPLVERIWELRTHVTPSDATYLALAEAVAVPLLTCDPRLSAAAGHRATVELVAEETDNR